MTGDPHLRFSLPDLAEQEAEIKLKVSESSKSCRTGEEDLAENTPEISQQAGSLQTWPGMDIQADLPDSGSKTRSQKEVALELLAAPEHPIRRWGIEFSIKAMLAWGSFALLFMRFFPEAAGDRQIADTMIAVPALLFCQVPLYIVWCIVLNKLIKVLTFLRPGESRKIIGETICTNIFLGPHSILALLVIASFLIAGLVFQMAEFYPLDPIMLSSLLLAANCLVFAGSCGPIMVGGVAYMAVFGWINDQLKSLKFESPMNALAAAALILSGILLPSLCLAFNCGVLSGFEFFLYSALQIGGLALAFSAVNKYRECTRKLVEDLPEDVRLFKEPEQIETSGSFARDILNKTGGLLASLAEKVCAISRIPLMVWLLCTMTVALLTGYAFNFAAHFSSGKTAIELYQLSLRLNPNITSAYGYLAKKYVAQGNPRAAKETLDLGIREAREKDFFTPSGDFLPQIRAQVVGYELSDPAQAARDLSQMIKKSLNEIYGDSRGAYANSFRNLAELHKLRSDMYLLAGDAARSKADMNQYTRLRNKAYECELTTAARHEAKGQWRQVLKDLEPLRSIGDEETLLRSAKISEEHLQDYASASADYSALIDKVHPSIAQHQPYKNKIQKYKDLRLEAERKWRLR